MLNSYNSPASTCKTVEILSRYRPIAPKPGVPAVSDGSSSPSSHSSSPSSTVMTQMISQPPYLMNHWPQLQPRPAGTRKRGRAAIPPASLKRQRLTHSASLENIHPVIPFPSIATACNGFSFQAFMGLGLPPQVIPAVSITTVESLNASGSPRLVTLPLLPCSSDSNPVPELDLSLKICPSSKIPEERDLLRQLQGPGSNSAGTVITPQPLRAVGSCITIGPITGGPLRPPMYIPVVWRNREELVEEIESEELPAVITDSNNKVRLVNSPYREMVGQPECSWLDSMMPRTAAYTDHRKGSTSSSRCRRTRRISGEVALQLFTGDEVPFLPEAFTCWAKIEWGSGSRKSLAKAFCEVNKLSYGSKDYVYAWRFHIHSTHASPEVHN
ncbi:hypothetical protein SAY86_027970 [Trapa natans]|uniref:DUF7950 domain-containing protein n=1 Tax=Trapa natans TaxID=22666 RepID=A0AAN7M1J7_TRANT|nr:hypothetical protein SAY86_027970 [Trapa natans]